MPDPNDTTQTSPAASPAAPAEQPATAAPTFTADQVAERERVAAQKAHDAAMAEARRVFEGKQKAQSTAQQPAPTATSPQTAPANGDDFGRVRAYERTLARYDFTDDALAMLDERFATEKPADVAGWVGKMATAFRVPQRGATPTAPATFTPPSAAAPAPQAPPAGPPVTGNGAPSNPVRMTDDVPLINRTEADRNAFLQQHGVVAYTDRIRKEAAANRTRFRLPRGG